MPVQALAPGLATGPSGPVRNGRPRQIHTPGPHLRREGGKRIPLKPLPRSVAALYRDALARASGLILATSLITALLGFGYWVLAARTFPSASVGTAAVSVSMMTLASLVSTLGTTAGPVQRIPLLKSRSEWNLTVSVSLVVGTLAGAFAGAIGWAVLVAFIHSPAFRSPSYFLAILIGVAATNGAMVLDSVWVVERLTHLRVVTNSLTSLVKIPLLVVPAFRAEGANGIQWGWTVAVAIGLAAGLILLRRRRGFEFRLRGMRPELSAMKGSMAGNYVMSVGAAAPTYVVPVLVGAAVTASQTAYFYAAWRIGSLFFLAANAVTNALFAEGSRAAASAVRKAQRAMLYLVPVLLGVTLLFALGGSALLSAFGPEYRRHAFGLLLFLIVAAVPDAVTAVYRTVLRIGSQFVRGSLLMWGLAIVQVSLTWPLVAAWGITGAGVAWLAAESSGVLVAAADRLANGDLALRAEARLEQRARDSRSGGVAPSSSSEASDDPVR